MDQTPQETRCPSCQQVVPPDEQGSLPAICPHCGAMLVVDDEVEDSQDQQFSEQELEEINIRRIVRERRAMIRTRSYYLVGLVACAVMALQFAINAGMLIRDRGFSRRATMWLLLIVAAVILGLDMLKRIRTVNAEMAKPLLEEPKAPPDFTALSDGSQHAKNLEKLDEQADHPDRPANGGSAL
jgi:predicted RNA-binding Zn-ribbon protein involved in translation (DUF1610 family)